jgi:hypothetical protein
VGGAGEEGEGEFVQERKWREGVVGPSRAVAGEWASLGHEVHVRPTRQREREGGGRLRPPPSRSRAYRSEKIEMAATHLALFLPLLEHRHRPQAKISERGVRWSGGQGMGGSSGGWRRGGITDWKKGGKRKRRGEGGRRGRIVGWVITA